MRERKQNRIAKNWRVPWLKIGELSSSYFFFHFNKFSLVVNVCCRLPPFLFMCQVFRWVSTQKIMLGKPEKFLSILFVWTTFKNSTVGCSLCGKIFTKFKDLSCLCIDISAHRNNFMYYLVSYTVGSLYNPWWR